MKTWKLTIKPKSKSGYDAFEVCRDNSLIGVGWSEACKESHSTNLEDTKKFYKGKLPYQIKYLMEDVEAGDHVWIHQGGHYYLCKVENNEMIIGKDIHKDFKKLDLGHARRAKWIEVSDVLVSGVVQRGTIAQRMIQRIHLEKFEEDYNEILYSKISENKKWIPNISENVLKKLGSNLSEENFYTQITTDDAEDIVSAYLQSKDWILIKSTCFRSKPEFEFSMLNKKREYCSVQVKSGKYPVSLKPICYKKYVSDNKFVYLFTTNDNPYPGESVEHVITISKEKLYDWVKNNICLLTRPLLLRLCIAYDLL